eukprot:10323899-Heterocapsa_arctica.AAC.1
MPTGHPEAILVTIEGLQGHLLLAAAEGLWSKPIHFLTHGKERGWRFVQRLFDEHPPSRPGT